MRSVILNNYVEADFMTIEDIISIYSLGFVSGIVLSVIPFLIGEIIRIAQNIMEGG